MKEHDFIKHGAPDSPSAKQPEEDLRITMGKMGTYISYYDVATGTLTTIPQTAKLFGVPLVMENYPEAFLANPPAGYPPETAEILRGFVDAIRRGEPAGACDYPTVTADGQKIRLRREFVTIFDEQNRPVRAVISSEDVTEEYEHTRQRNLDRLGLIQAGETIFPEMVAINLTKQHYRMVRHYGLMEGTPTEGPLEEMLNLRLGFVAPEDQDAFRRNFFPQSMLELFQRGRGRIQLAYRRIGPDGVLHWIETMAVRQDNPYNDDLLVFAVTRNIDQQKIEAERLQQALAESVDRFDGWHYYNRLTHRTYRGLTYVHYLDERPSPYVVGGLARRLDCPEKELVLGTCFRIPQEDQKTVTDAYQKAIHHREASFHSEYRVETDRGELVWVRNLAERFTDKQGGTGYIHFLTDTTREHLLMERLQEHMEAQLKKSEQIFGIVAQHSNRILYQHDLTTATMTPWDEGNEAKDLLAHIYTDFHSVDALDQNSFIMPESLEDVKKFFSDMRSGVPFGDMNIHIKLQDGQPRWYHFKYSSFFDGGKPVTALLSAEDITERHNHELAYLRHTQSVIDNTEKNLLYMEGCLICDRIERLSGLILSEDEINSHYSYSAFKRELLDQKFTFEEREVLERYFSIDNLLNLYAQGERQLESEWKALFSDGTSHWLLTEIVLMPDPFNNHVKVFIQIRDITEEKETSLSFRQQAEYDAMTGLLRRGVGENRIREYLSAHKSPGGILIILDLDDLKGINDTLGHIYGDKAIIGIADTLKEHFRKDDVLIRAGGDEFMVFLPGAEKGVYSVKLSLAALLGKLSAIPIADNRTIHCSAGCAVELPDTDTFDSLYQRADIALYHVKRRGKNNFAFFEPAMLEGSYRLKIQQAVPVVSNLTEGDDLRSLLEVVTADYPGVVQFNLTRNYFRILSTGYNVENVHAPDKVDVFWESWRENIHPDDWDNMISTMSRAELFALYTQGKRRFKHFYRNKEAAGYVGTEVDVRFFAAENGDIGAFLFFRQQKDPGP